MPDRLENFQKALGVPVPTSTQWDNAHSVFKTAVHPYDELVRQSAQGELFHIDDTGVKILEIMKENKMREAVAEVIARFNPLKKFGPLTGRTQNEGRAPTHAPLQRKKKI